MELSDYKYIYPCRTRCLFNGREWIPGEIFATNDPGLIPPHHFEGGVNPKDADAVKKLIAERTADTGDIAEGEENDDDGGDATDDLGPLPFADIPAAERTAEQKAALKAERIRRKALTK